MFFDAEERGEGGDDVRFIAERRQLHEPHAVGIPRELAACDLEREPRLPDAARAEQRDDAVFAKEILDARDVVVPADQRCARNRQVVRRRQQRERAFVGIDVGGIDHDDTVAPGAFGTVERAIGALEQFAIMRAALGNGRGHAHADRHDPARRRFVRDRKLFHRRAQAFRHFRCAARFGVGDHDPEFLAAVPREAIGRAHHAFFARARDPAQTRIALRMSVGVVVVLEVVDIEQGDRDRPLRADRAGPLTVERGVERAPVRHAREPVHDRELLEVPRMLAQRRFLQRERQIAGKGLAEREPVFVVDVAARDHPHGTAHPAVVA